MTLIGVVFTGDPRMQQIFRGNYGKAVRRGGGVPVFLPWKPKHAAFWAKHLDGFLFTGGGDPDPRYYGQSMRPECGTPTPARDEFELALLKAVMDTGKPVLGICRGGADTQCGAGRNPDSGHTQPAPRSRRGEPP